MEHVLIYTIISGFVLAFLFGAAAVKMGLPAIFGYLLAGVAIGPHTPGFVADTNLAKQLAEVGIILLMFGVGLHFSFQDLMNVRRIALPGALVQIITTTVIGAITSHYMGYTLVQGLVFGFSLSVASTIVLLRLLEKHRMLHEEGGKIAIGWLIVEDIAMVLALIMLPICAEMHTGEQELSYSLLAWTAIVVLLKIAAFFAITLIFGRRFIPMFLIYIAKLRSAELNTLGTLALALGFAFLAHVLFDASFALGAFLAGMMLNRSELGRKSAEHSLPLQDAFSVLFFVSVGMLFEPTIVFTQPLAVLMTFFIIVCVKSLSALVITQWFKQPHDVSYIIAIGLAQIGEFSFIFSSLALMKGMIVQEQYNLILAGAMLSIMVNPFLFRFYTLFGKKQEVS